MDAMLEIAAPLSSLRLRTYCSSPLHVTPLLLDTRAEKTQWAGALSSSVPDLHGLEHVGDTFHSEDVMKPVMRFRDQRAYEATMNAVHIHEVSCACRALSEGIFFLLFLFRRMLGNSFRDTTHSTVSGCLSILVA